MRTTWHQTLAIKLSQRPSLLGRSAPTSSLVKDVPGSPQASVGSIMLQRLKKRFPASTGTGALAFAPRSIARMHTLKTQTIKRSRRPPRTSTWC